MLQYVDDAHPIYLGNHPSYAVLLRATRETRETPLVEAGTSFSLSATRLALAVVQNAALCGEGGKVIATENESVKTDRARVHWEMLGDAFTPWAELREA
ncbi:hypothetical protein PMIN02_005953 [Paraphaeosphaeria minitans]